MTLRFILLDDQLSPCNSLQVAADDFQLGVSGGEAALTLRDLSLHSNCDR
jgi:hypothetical protein